MTEQAKHTAGPRVCEQADHTYEPGPYRVCRRCGGESPTDHANRRAILAATRAARAAIAIAKAEGR